MTRVANPSDRFMVAIEAIMSRNVVQSVSDGAGVLYS